MAFHTGRSFSSISLFGPKSTDVRGHSLVRAEELRGGVGLWI